MITIDRNIKKQLRKILKVIRYFETDAVFFSENENIQFDEYGEKIDTTNKINIKIAIMTPEQGQAIQGTAQESFLSDRKEGYYILKDSDDFTISENSKIEVNGTVYRVIAIENNYDIFLRLELNLDDKRN